MHLMLTLKMINNKIMDTILNNIECRNWKSYITIIKINRSNN